MNIPNSVLDYWKSHGITTVDHLYCKNCNKFMPDLTELEEQPILFYMDGLYLSKERIPLKFIESLQNRFLIKGRIFENKLYFRQLCWDCFHKELEKTIVEKFKTREIKYTWYRKYLKGELKDYYPVYSQSACFYFKFLFGLNDDLLDRECKKFVTANLDAYIRKYGDNDLARRKYDEYCKVQAKSGCTLDYFVEKYGEEEGTRKYKEVCNSKAITKENCIKKYGITYGQQLFKDYCKKQEYAGCKLEYFIEKYGETEGRKKYDEICHQKALTLTNFIRKYGEEQGKQEYKRWLASVSIGFSLISQKFFDAIDAKLGEYSKESKWAMKNGEAEFEIEVETDDGWKSKRFAKPDYLLNNKIIEFNGDYWHFNPTIYGPDETRYLHEDQTISAKEIWKADKKRNDGLEKLGMKVKVVWENDYKENPEKIVEECCEFLKNDR